MLFGGKKIRELEAELATLRKHFNDIGATDAIAVNSYIVEKKRELANIETQIVKANTELDSLKLNIVETDEIALLQEIGIYKSKHQLSDVVAYQDRIKRNQESIKSLAKGEAVQSNGDWSVNGSKTEGRKLSRDLSKLMLRAYNSEAENISRTLKSHNLESAISRLDKARTLIEKLGAIINLHIDDRYHQLHIEDLELMADYMVKLEEEKERQRQERARQREEEKALREFEAEKKRLEKEQTHYITALERLKASGDESSIAEMEAKIAQIASAIAGIESREANIRTGYVYVISNFGSFGSSVVKIGLTRRLDPLDRVRELSDASVPFNFDVHAIIFSDDAVGLETRLHSHFASKRVNLVNMRREYFFVTPHEVKEALISIGGQQLLEFNEIPDAPEWRASTNTREPA